jgi:6-phosphogluconate dehydrogenase
MKRGPGVNDDEMREGYALCNKGELNGPPIEITGNALSAQDEKTGKRLLDAYRSVWSPSNLIQAQRDSCCAHTYERVYVKGPFHTRWEAE